MFLQRIMSAALHLYVSDNRFIQENITFTSLDIETAYYVHSLMRHVGTNINLRPKMPIYPEVGNRLADLFSEALYAFSVPNNFLLFILFMCSQFPITFWDRFPWQIICGNIRTCLCRTRYWCWKMFFLSFKKKDISVVLSSPIHWKFGLRLHQSACCFWIFHSSIMVLVLRNLWRK